MNRVFLFFDTEMAEPELARLIADLGGEIRPNMWTAARLTRGGGRTVWIDLAEQSFRAFTPADRAEFERKLGTPIRGEAILYVSPARGSDQIALDVIEAAARRRRVAVYDDRGNTLTADELRERTVAEQPFRFVPEPSRPRMGDSVHLLCADPITPDDVMELAAALGGVPRRNGGALDAALWRDGNHVWARAAPERLAELGAWWSRECAEHLGAPVRGLVELTMPRERGADRLALEVIEAAAERWSCVVTDCWDVVSTPDELRRRAATDPWYLFVPATWRSRLPGRDPDTHTIAFAEPVEPERFLELMDSLGAVRDPDGWTDAGLSDQDGHVWVAARPEYQLDCLRSAREYEKKLGAPFANVMTLHASRSLGGERLRRRIVRAAARHWRLVVDDGRGEIAAPRP